MDNNIKYNTPAVTVGNLVRDGDEFILISRQRQGAGFTVHSSSDREVTTQLMPSYRPTGDPQT
jgi:hypothetical protein